MGVVLFIKIFGISLCLVSQNELLKLLKFKTNSTEHLFGDEKSQL